MRRLLVLSLLVTATVSAQPNPTPSQPVRRGSDASATAKGEVTVLVPPQGGTADIAVHYGTATMLSFPSALASSVIQSSEDWQVRAFADGLGAMVSAVTPKAAPTTIALATKNNDVRVNVTLRLAPTAADGVTLVRFQAATAEEAFDAAVAVAVDARTAQLKANAAELRRTLDVRVRERASAMIARGVLTRLDVQRVIAHERNDDGVIVHGDRFVLQGPDAYLLFKIENRTSAPYRLASVTVVDPTGTNRAGAAVLESSFAGDPDAGLIGVVSPGTTARVAIVLPQVDGFLRKTLTLTIEEPSGRGRVVLDRGLSVR